MDFIQLLAILSPLLVYAATWLVGKFFTAIPGWTITTLIVPGLSALVAYFSSASTGSSMTMQFAYGLLAVFVNEFIKQLKQLKTGE